MRPIGLHLKCDAMVLCISCEITCVASTGTSFACKVFFDGDLYTLFYYKSSVPLNLRTKLQYTLYILYLIQYLIKIEYTMN